MAKLWLYGRMFIAIAAIFAILYGLIVLIAYLLGFYGTTAFIFLAFFAFILVFLQYWISPKIVEATMHVKYVSEKEMPWLHEIVERLAKQAGIPKPKVGIANVAIPNAFAFGRSKKDGRVCVTKGLLKILNKEEIEAVLGHEISHIKHRDMVVITMLSVIPLISYLIFWNSLWSRDRRNGAVAAIAFLVYLLTNLIVLYVNRLREYYADYGSAELTKKPHLLASALYRITLATYGMPVEEIKKVEGMKAFFATDPSKARHDLMELRKADLNMNGHLDEQEVKLFASHAKPSKFDKIMEIFSSHPNIIDRIKKLAEVE
ncbi:MAG: M48 family metalloprotease [Thermoplasmata archaeon]|nr:M48 family metalloprotease [Thermoplasmata archaeon]